MLPARRRPGDMAAAAIAGPAIVMTEWRRRRVARPSVNGPPGCNRQPGRRALPLPRGPVDEYFRARDRPSRARVPLPRRGHRRRTRPATSAGRHRGRQVDRSSPNSTQPKASRSDEPRTWRTSGTGPCGRRGSATRRPSTDAPGRGTAATEADTTEAPQRSLVVVPAPKGRSSRFASGSDAVPEAE